MTRKTISRSSAGLRLQVAVTGLGLVGLGLAMILSASSVEAFQRYGSSFLFFNRQVVGAAIGIGLMFALARIDYRKLKRWVVPIVGVTIAALIAVLVPGVGVARGGSTRWLDIGPFSFQPSELAKVALILASAAILVNKRQHLGELRELAVPLFPLTGSVFLLIILQPDLGTAVICAAIVMCLIYLGGARLTHIAGMVTSGVVLVAGLSLAEGYRRARLFSFLNPWSDPLDSGYQQIQSQIAYADGGLFGVGLGAGRQKWSYVPNAHTDFIMSIVGEELGWVGTVLIVCAFVFLVYLGIRVARAAPDRFGYLLAAGVTGWIGIQALVNMGAVTGLLPITGVPLPFISFGGSALVFTLAGVGILLSVAARAKPTKVS